MARSHAVPVTLLVVLGLAAAGCGGSDASVENPETDATTQASGGGKTLRGTVGPGFEISLAGTEGLTAGSYTLVVDDRSSAHNFHLIGPDGSDLSTDVAGEGEQSFEVEFQPGEYRFLCDPHAGSMNGSFTVG